MYCWKCGNEIPADARFCTACGADQQQAPQAPPDAPLQPEAPQTPPQAPPPPEPPQTPPSGPSAWNPGGGPVSREPAPENGNEMILKIFAGVCAVLYGVAAVRGIIGVFQSLFSFFFRFFSFPTLINTVFGLLGAVLFVWMALVMAMFILKRTPQNTDGLLMLLAGGAVGIAAVRLLSMIFNLLFGRYWYTPGSLVGSFFLAVLAAAAAVAGVYAILRFLLGENPLVGKSQEQLKQELQDTLAGLGQTASEAAQSVKAGQEQRRAQQQAYAPQPGQQPPQQPYAPQPGQQPPPPPTGYAPFRLKADRSLIAYILLTFVTCGIYSWFFIYSLARDVNVACAGDGKQTAGLIKLLLLSFITCGIYAIFWYYSLGNRLAANAPRYGLNFQENGTTILLWMVLGSLLCGIGSFVALHIIIKNTNAICGAYNYQHGI